MRKLQKHEQRDRNLKIYRLVESGEFTLEEIGNMFNTLSRQRISIIHKSIKKLIGG